MADRIDSERLKRESSLENLISQNVELKPHSANQLIGLCPFHAEKTPSFFVWTDPEDQHYHCMGCGEHGDIFDYLGRMQSLSFLDAVKFLTGEDSSSSLGSSSGPSSVAAGRAPDPYEGVCAVHPAPYESGEIKTGTTVSIYNPKRAGSQQEVWNIDVERADAYRTPEGRLLGYELRTTIKGRKVPAIVQWCEWNEGEAKGWSIKPFKTPAPLMGLDELKNRPDDPVIVVEGPKCKKAAAILLPDYVAVTWPGGTGAVGKADWSPLKNRRVLCWPDADAQGLQAMTFFVKDGESVKPGVKGLLKGEIYCKVIGWDKTKEKGWDCADAMDEGWTAKQAIEWARSMLIEDIEKHLWETGVTPDTPQPEEEEGPPIEVYEDGPTIANNEPEPPPAIEFEDYFQILGYNQGKYFFLPKATNQVVRLSPSSFDRTHLITLAPSHFWFSIFRGKSTWVNATEFLITAAHRIGVFHESDTIRGRGAWIDAGRKVIHLGDRLNVDGYRIDNSEIESNYIYPEGKKISLSIEQMIPATNEQAGKLIEITSRLSWDNSISGVLLSGWCVIAPVCGILDWRPHVWLTGESGCGKSTVIKDIVHALLKDFSLQLDGSTTEAGIRQTLGQDALPVLFDEIENDSQADDQRITAILKTIRVASSGGEIIKGSTSGSVTRFVVRSCFFLSSISVSAIQRADKSRLTTLWLRKDESEDAGPRYEQLADDMLETFTPMYASSMLARTVRHLDVLLHNCESFIHAASKVFKDRRTADQFGPMFAGAYLCESVEKITHQEAKDWINNRGEGLETFRRQAEEKDCRSLLEKICATRIDVEWNRGGGPTNRKRFSIGSAITEVMFRTPNEMDAGLKEAIKERLIEAGIRCDKDPEFEEVPGFMISNKGSELSAILRGSQWSNNWNRTLMELPGAEASKGGAVYFGRGNRQRATHIPFSLIQDEEPGKFKNEDDLSDLQF